MRKVVRSLRARTRIAKRRDCFTRATRSALVKNLFGGELPAANAVRDADAMIGVAGQLHALGQDVSFQSFQAIPSTYQPFVLIFAIALTSTLCVLVSGARLWLASKAPCSRRFCS